MGTAAKAMRCCGLLMAAGILFLFSQRGTFAATPAQTRQEIQAVCDRGVVRYRQRNLNGFMAMYSPSYRETNVVGRIYDYRQTLASIAADMAVRRPFSVARIQVRSLSLHGAAANAMIDFHFAVREKGFTYMRDYTERTVWAKGKQGWRESSGQMTRDARVYQRLP